MSCGVSCRLGLDPMLLWLWLRPPATAPIRPLAWEPPYVMGVALEKVKRQKDKKAPKKPLKYGVSTVAQWDKGHGFDPQSSAVS